jgi:hypothetical protein
MQSAFFSPAPPHATMDLRAAAAARGQANASHDAAAPPPSTRARATTNHAPADGADDETAAAGEGVTSANSHHRPDASAKDADAAEDTDAAREGRALASDEDVEAVKDPRGIIGSSVGRYNAALLQRAESQTEAKRREATVEFMKLAAKQRRLRQGAARMTDVPKVAPTLEAYGKLSKLLHSERPPCIRRCL